MLATLVQLKANLGIADADNDTQLTAALGMANALIASYIGADLSAADVDRTYTTTLGPRVRLEIRMPVYPVLEVSGVTANGEAVLEEGYDLDYAVWYLTISACPVSIPGRPGTRVTVVYKAGYVDVPDDLNMVCLNLAAAIYKNGGSFADAMNGGKGDLKSLTMFDAMSMSFETNAGASADAAGTPEGMLKAWAFVLDQYQLKTPVLK